MTNSGYGWRFGAGHGSREAGIPTSPVKDGVKQIKAGFRTNGDLVQRGPAECGELQRQAPH
jgi:hypothetical protein